MNSLYNYRDWLRNNKFNHSDWLYKYYRDNYCKYCGSVINKYRVCRCDIIEKEKRKKVNEEYE